MAVQIALTCDSCSAEFEHRQGLRQDGGAQGLRERARIRGWSVVQGTKTDDRCPPCHRRRS